MAAVQVRCPHCSSAYIADAQDLGPSARCPRCGGEFDVAGSGCLKPLPTAFEAAPDIPLGPMVAATPEPPELPEQFGRYRILSRLGQGSMGAVYLAVDVRLNRQVALKIPFFRPGGGSVIDRFLREARAAAKLDHPGLCPVFDVGQVDGTYYLTMPYIEGKPLSKAIDANRPTPLRQAAAVVRRLALAMDEAHRNGIVHRDLKPGNVMVNRRRELVIMDFGLARLDDPGDASLTGSGAVLGTPLYMSPEQVEGISRKIGPASDIYSLGVILYELLTGRCPFLGSVTNVLAQIAYMEPPPPSQFRPDLDPALEAICLKAIAKKPRDRFTSMADFAAALGDYVRGRVSRESFAPAVASNPARTLGTNTQVEAFFADLDLHLEPSVLMPRKPAPPSWNLRLPSPKRWLQAAAIVTGAILLLATTFYVVTDRGTIRIALDAAGAEVRVDGREVGVGPNALPLTLRTGTHELVARRGGEVVLSQEFVVKRGENPALKGVVPSSPKAASAAAPRQFTNAVAMTLVRIEPGSFTMGSSDGPGDETPAHPVRISRAFYLGAHEVTRGQYKAVMGATLDDASGPDDLPVEHVSWLDAVTFCNTLSTREGRTPCYRVDGNIVTRIAGDGYRLPTEAEWEYACRAGTTTTYPFGNNEADLGEYAWFDGNSESKCHPVGQKRPNPWGLHDMLGNAWEWCQDGYDEAYYETSVPVDPPGPPGTTSRVLRGGGWLGLPWSCRPAYRGMGTPDDRSRNLGFRVATSQAGI